MMFKKLAFLAWGLIATNAYAQVPDDMPLMGKPVPCGTKEIGTEILLGFYELGMRPIMGFVASSYTTKGFKFPSDYYIMYNTEENQIAIIEKRMDGYICIITGGSKSYLSFDSEKLEELLFDIFREEL